MARFAKKDVTHIGCFYEKCTKYKTDMNAWIAPLYTRSKQGSNPYEKASAKTHNLFIHHFSFRTFALCNTEKS